MVVSTVVSRFKPRLLRQEVFREVVTFSFSVGLLQELLQLENRLATVTRKGQGRS